MTHFVTSFFAGGGQFSSAIWGHFTTANDSFTSLAYLNPVEHSGLVLLRLPSELPVKTVNEILLRALRNLSPEEITGSIIVVDQDKVRIRPKK